MKKPKELLHRIPRPCRALFNLALALCLAAAFYFSIGSPVISQKHAFRRAECANLVGPSTILFSDKLTDYDYSHLIVAETNQGVITFATDDHKPSSFNYFRKTGDITVVSAPKRGFLWGLNYVPVNLPVFVVHDHPEAFRAELDLNIKGTLEYDYNGEICTQTLDQNLHADSEQWGIGYFRFMFRLEELEGGFFNKHGADGFALDVLASSYENIKKLPTDGVTITAVVRLYAADGTLLLEQEQILQPNDRYWE